jgi:MFS family permease
MVQPLGRSEKMPITIGDWLCCLFAVDDDRLLYRGPSHYETWATNLLRASGILVAFGFGFALLGTTYFAAMFGFLFAGFGLSNMVALIFGAAARRFPGGVGAAIAASASVGYLGFLVGPPAVGSLSGVVGLRAALALVVVAGVVISLAARTVMAETA